MRALRISVVAILLSAASALLPPAAAAEPVRPADEFVDSIGVNVHMTYGDTAYRDRDRLIDALSAAGIRHVRDGLSHDTDYAYASFNRMAGLGIRTTFIMGDPSERGDTLDQLLFELRNKLTRAAEAVEGPNEYDHSGDPSWADNLRAYQGRLHAAIKDDPRLAHLPVLAPSLITWQSHAALGPIGSIDLGNKHPYAGGDMPEAGIENELSVAARVAGARPVVATEAGYHNAIATGDGHRPASEDAAATYIPRMFLEHFRRGIPRTFAYELIDEWPDPERRHQESNFGLLRNDYSEKPAFRRLASLIAVLADPGPAHPVTPLDVAIDGPADLRRVALQKRDGTHFLVLWRAVRVWDPVARRAMHAPDATVSLDLGTAAASAGLIDPATGATRSAPHAEGRIAIAVGAEPVVVRIAGTPVGPGPAPAEGAEPAPGSGPPPAPPAARLDLGVKGQRARSVLRRGLLLRCRTDRGAKCKATVTHARKRVASGQGTLDVTGAASLRARVNGRGAKLLRRAIARRRAVRVRVKATAAGATVTRSVVLRP